MAYLLLLSALTASSSAFAQGVGEAGVEYVGNNLIGVSGGGFGAIAEQIARSAVLFVNGAAIIAIVISGMLAVVGQDENRIASARRVASMSIVAIVLINVSYAIANAYITAFNYDFGADAEAGTDIITTEVLGFIAFAEVPVAIIAIITIMVYGIKALVDYNGEQGLQAFKKAVLSVLLGILILVVKFAVATAITTGDPGGIINPAVRTLFTVVSYAALVGVVVIVFGGIYLILNLADEARATKAKNIIISVVAGLIFMIVISGLLAILVNAVF